MERPEGYPISDEQLGHQPEMKISSSSFECPPLFDRNDEECNDLSVMESGLYRRTYSDMGDNHHRILERAKRLIGKSSFDPRVLVLLEFFREFYVRGQELLKKIFPGLQNEFIEFFRKVGRALAEAKTNQLQVKTMQRSLSLGSPPTPLNKGDESPLRLERFKIRTVKLGGDDQVQEGGGQSGQGPTKPSGSK